MVMQQCYKKKPMSFALAESLITVDINDKLSFCVGSDSCLESIIFSPYIINNLGKNNSTL